MSDRSQCNFSGTGILTEVLCKSILKAEAKHCLHKEASDTACACNLLF